MTRLTTGKDVTATSMLERFGFTGDKLTARLGDLSGGERRRFQLLRLLLSEPNVLLLDEPTNDLDIDTLNVVEDFLDNWPGTLVVVSHDRYFLERVTDSVWALMGDGLVSMLPGGVDQYLEHRASMPTGQLWSEERSGATQGALSAQLQETASRESAADQRKTHQGDQRATAGSAQERTARKTIARLDKRLGRIATREAELNALMTEHLTDHERLTELSRELSRLRSEKESLEIEWIEAAEQLS
jgi:ATP-binding cassette subfamily F protein uup